MYNKPAIFLCVERPQTTDLFMSLFDFSIKRLYLSNFTILWWRKFNAL